MTHSDEMIASHRRRTQGVAEQRVVITQIISGLNHAKNESSI